MVHVSSRPKEMAKTRGYAKPKRQPKQLDKYDRAKQGKQQRAGHSSGSG